MRTRVALVAAGAVLIAYAMIGALSDAAADPIGMLVFLVGVLVVIAILAIALFRPKLQELWNAIAEGINSL